MSFQIFPLHLALLSNVLANRTFAVPKGTSCSCGTTVQCFSSLRALPPPRADAICVVLFGAAGAKGLQSQRVSRFFHQAATRLRRPRGLGVH